MPRVLNKRRDLISVDDVYIGRPSPWGNPFIVNQPQGREIAIKRYREYAEFMYANNPDWIEPLRGKNLVCFCKPLACHGDVLMEMLERTNA